MPSIRGIYRLWKKSREMPHPYRFMLFHIVCRLHLDGKLTFRYQDCRFRLYCTPVAANMYYNAERWHCTRDILFLKQLVRPGEVVVDIGANLGSHAICLAHHVGVHGAVHAFEPHPVTFRRLQQNAQLNRLPQLQIYNVALGDTEGMVQLTSFPSDDLNRVVSRSESEVETVPVPLEPLDSFELFQRPISVLKVDVEGYELFVLRGARQTLKQTAFLYFEVADAHFELFGYTTRDLLTLLHEEGWQVFRFCSEKQIKRVEPNLKVSSAENLIATRSIESLLERVPLEIVESHGG